MFKVRDTGIVVALTADTIRTNDVDCIGLTADCFVVQIALENEERTFGVSLKIPLRASSYS
ncbi:hypothetical protein BDQ17DRAFT_1371968 [Cyathus striatus]|nr:hypothetical protein BDQ17DRAFT_1371968 [Cyathus striatus]